MSEQNMFDDLLEDLDESYKGMSKQIGLKFLKEDDLLAGFTGKYLGYERKESQYGPTTWWKFEVNGQEIIINRPHVRETLDKEKKIMVKKPTRFLVALMGAKVSEGEMVEIKQTGTGMATEYLIKVIEK